MAARVVLVPATIIFTMFPFLLGVLCVMVVGGPWVAAAAFFVTIPAAVVRPDDTSAAWLSSLSFMIVSVLTICA